MGMKLGSIRFYHVILINCIKLNLDHVDLHDPLHEPLLLNTKCSLKIIREV
jgi:hypothetical protein